MSPQGAFLYTYGVYLANGGTPDGFMDLTPQDVQLMYTVHVAEKNRDNLVLLKGIAKIMSKVMGGTDTDDS